MPDRSQTPQEAWSPADRVMSWYGWGSPVGLGLLAVGLGLAALLVRLALVGW